MDYLWQMYWSFVWDTWLRYIKTEHLYLGPETAHLLFKQANVETSQYGRFLLYFISIIQVSSQVERNNLKIHSLTHEIRNKYEKCIAKELENSKTEKVSAVDFTQKEITTERKLPDT